MARQNNWKYGVMANYKLDSFFKIQYNKYALAYYNINWPDHRLRLHLDWPFVCCEETGTPILRQPETQIAVTEVRVRPPNRTNRSSWRPWVRGRQLVFRRRLEAGGKMFRDLWPSSVAWPKAKQIWKWIYNLPNIFEVMSGSIQLLIFYMLYVRKLNLLLRPL